MNDSLIERLSDEAEFCKQVGVFSIAKLLDEARAAIERQSAAPQPLTDEQIDSASPVNAEHAHSFKRGARFAEAAHSITKGTASPQAQPLSDADVQQISRALHQHGLTLVRTVQGFGVMKLGEITAYAATKGTT